MSIVSVLKIIRNDNIILLTDRAIQTITPISEYKPMRNVNGGVVFCRPKKALFKTVIKTMDSPDVDSLQLGEKYKIYSIVRFESNEKPDYECMPLTENDSVHVYRPVFEMVLTSFNLSQLGSKQEWIMEFSQI